MFMYLYSEDCPDHVRKQFGPNKKCAVVYEFYNKQDEIVYVGKTTNFCSRWSMHFRSDKPILDVVRIVIKTYSNYAEASFVEAQQIAKLKPAWNKQGKDEKISRKKMKHKEIFSLVVLTKRLTEFREQENIMVSAAYKEKPLAEFPAHLGEELLRLDKAAQKWIEDNSMQDSRLQETFDKLEKKALYELEVLGGRIWKQDKDLTPDEYREKVLSGRIK